MDARLSFPLVLLLLFPGVSPAQSLQPVPDCACPPVTRTVQRESWGIGCVQFSRERVDTFAPGYHSLIKKNLLGSVEESWSTRTSGCGTVSEHRKQCTVLHVLKLPETSTRSEKQSWLSVPVAPCP